MKRKMLAVIIPVLLFLGIAGNAYAEDSKLNNTVRATVSEGNVIITDTAYSPADAGLTSVYIIAMDGAKRLYENSLPLVNGKITLSLKSLNFSGTSRITVKTLLELRVGNHFVRSDLYTGVVISKTGTFIKQF